MVCVHSLDVDDKVDQLAVYYPFDSSKAWLVPSSDEFRDEILVPLVENRAELTKHWKQIAHFLYIPYPIHGYIVSNDHKKYIRYILSFLLNEAENCKTATRKRRIVYSKLRLNLLADNTDPVTVVKALEYGLDFF